MIDDLKAALGEKGFWIVIIAAVGLFAIALIVGQGSSTDDGEVLVTPTGYTSYPDAVTNANTIIDSINQFTEYTGDRIIASTSGYMEEGLAGIHQGLEESFDQLDSSIIDLGGKVDTVSTKVDSVASDVGSIKTSISTLKDSSTTVKVSSSSTKKSSSSTKKTTTAAATTSAATTVTKPAAAAQPETYAKSSYTGVSLVDGLKSVGVYSLGGKNVGDWTSRSALAAANGITNYTGTPAQNTQLLNKLKTGTLVKPS